MVTVPISPLEKLRPDDLPRVTQLLDEFAFPSQPLYQGQSLPTLFSMSPLGTQIIAFKALWLPGFREPGRSPRPLQRCGMARYCPRPVSKQKLCLSPAQETEPCRQACLTAQAGKLSPALRLLQERAWPGAVGPQPPRPRLGFLSAFGEERSLMPIRRAASVSRQALLCLRQKAGI